MIVIKNIPKKMYKVIAGRVILIFEMPTELIIIFSDPFMSPR